MAQTPSNCVAQPLSINGASGSQPGNPPSNVLDSNLNTIWSNIGVGSWIIVDVGSIKTICSVDIAWYRGDLRQYNFNIRVWDSAAQQWKMVFNGKSIGATAGFERYNVPDTSGQYVVIFVNGNTENSQASISEIDVNGITGSIICGNQPLILNAASGGEAANPPSNAIDNALSTRWSNNAIGSWIIVDLGSIKTVCSVDISWYRGDLRQYNFNIRVWDSAAQQWKMVFNGKSSGATAGFERYNVQDTNGRYVVIFVNGNTENNFASISEIDVNGLTSIIPTIRDSSLQVQVVAAGLSLPTSMAFIGPNDILVLEKNTGMVKRVKDGAVLSPPLLDVNVATDSERGMLGIDDYTWEIIDLSMIAWKRVGSISSVPY